MDKNSKKPKKVRILVACGSGIATATVAAEAVKEICKSEGINCDIIKGNIYEIDSNIKNVDIVLTTSRTRRSLEKPSMSVSGLISGVKEKETRDGLIEILHKVTKKV